MCKIIWKLYHNSLQYCHKKQRQDVTESNHCQTATLKHYLRCSSSSPQFSSFFSPVLVECQPKVFLYNQVFHHLACYPSCSCTYVSLLLAMPNWKIIASTLDYKIKKGKMEKWFTLFLKYNFITNQKNYWS